MRLYALVCSQCDKWCPIRERDGFLVIACSEHGDESLYVADAESDVKRRMTWADLIEIERIEDAKD